MGTQLAGREQCCYFGNDDAYAHSQYPGNVTINTRKILTVISEVSTYYMDIRALSRVYSEMDHNVIDIRALMIVNS